MQCNAKGRLHQFITSSIISSREVIGNTQQMNEDGWWNEPVAGDGSSFHEVASAKNSSMKRIKGSAFIDISTTSKRTCIHYMHEFITIMLLTSIIKLLSCASYLIYIFICIGFGYIKFPIIADETLLVRKREIFAEWYYYYHHFLLDYHEVLNLWSYFYVQSYINTGMYVYVCRYLLVNSIKGSKWQWMTKKDFWVWMKRMYKQSTQYNHWSRHFFQARQKINKFNPFGMSESKVGWPTRFYFHSQYTYECMHICV